MNSVIKWSLIILISIVCAWWAITPTTLTMTAKIILMIGFVICNVMLLRYTLQITDWKRLFKNRYAKGQMMVLEILGNFIIVFGWAAISPVHLTPLLFTAWLAVSVVCCAGNAYVYYRLVTYFFKNLVKVEDK
ncbi:hypothetical protein HC026_03450 [Lactobacillus sp. LC28-10]|uniref:Uncharacterized protein n=1 Tax=Secundilactobacillus angelensis TaxID=2722706 RepID=A0ABX1L0Z8_9LACO|nr:hypothetical protein [Secundilactobacillus angelensis]MCH5461680.1 hypothetical protein [Secundilactobacillus angelensis]NLR17976.1 hypothetical protein [Secundilactobacillus angelensis]